MTHRSEKLNKYLEGNDRRLFRYYFDLISQETGSPFTDCDVATFEAFAIFCGLGIHNTQMYESACKYMTFDVILFSCVIIPSYFDNPLCFR